MQNKISIMSILSLAISAVIQPLGTSRKALTKAEADLQTVTTGLIQDVSAPIDVTVTQLTIAKNSAVNAQAKVRGAISAISGIDNDDLKSEVTGIFDTLLRNKEISPGQHQLALETIQTGGVVAFFEQMDSQISAFIQRANDMARYLPELNNVSFGAGGKSWAQRQKAADIVRTKRTELTLSWTALFTHFDFLGKVGDRAELVAVDAQMRKAA